MTLGLSIVRGAATPEELAALAASIAALSGSADSDPWEPRAVLSSAAAGPGLADRSSWNRPPTGWHGANELAAW
ncbi:MAG: hypothetical protein LBJ02_07585 [Bifidobacteriaceae bacterium]|jgi:hypothetical protein|nr:hypothetical protein [Bifidobacteriaceae bacterium]